jgi:hypothetical protein
MPLTFIDLFCGCGGFTLGMERAGFKCLAAIDSNKEAIEVFQKNFPLVPHALHEDLTKFSVHELADLLRDQAVDVIVGGQSVVIPGTTCKKVHREDLFLKIETALKLEMSLGWQSPFHILITHKR